MTKSLAVEQRANLDTESRGIIFQGASANQLGELFNMRPADVLKRLGDLQPAGFGRQGNPLYLIKDAAARLIRIPVTPEMIDAYMRRVNARDLPPILNKIYWEGKMVRERYREQANELWLTADVIRVASEAFQSLRMSVLLIPDVLRDETDLSERQFAVVQAIIDKALEVARVRLVSDLRKSNDPRSGFVGEDGEL